MYILTYVFTLIHDRPSSATTSTLTPAFFVVFAGCPFGWRTRPGLPSWKVLLTAIIGPDTEAARTSFHTEIKYGALVESGGSSDT